MIRASFLILLCALAMGSCRVSKKFSHNKSVKQEVISRDGDSVVVIPGNLYEAGPAKRFWLGDHYRDVWLAPVKVRVLDFDSAKGGLTIEKRGGGMQTYSLKVKAKNGKLYSIRSIQKDPTPALPKPLQYSFADDFVQDQISSSHPFGAFVLPPLGDKAGIYHTNPELVYIPDTPQLGEHREDFGGMLAMIEEDADEDWSDYEDFGYTENAVSSNSMMEALREDNDNRIDEENMVRLRLFDMWIGDWDRHEGQMRWAEIETEGKGTLYRPIPEDRDNMMFRADGFIPNIMSRKWALRKFQDFHDVEVRDMKGLNFNGRFNDRRLLTELSREEWIEIAADLQRRLTDESIEQAIRTMPDNAFEISGEKMISTLKARREMLKSYAERYYEILAKEVDVLGSDKQELFEIKRLPNGDTEVSVYKTNDDAEKEKLLYNRTFHPDETEEVRLYGLNDDDFFHLSGETDEKSVFIRMIPGLGEDVLRDEAKVKRWGKHAKYYELEEEDNDIEAGKDTRVIQENSLDITRYHFKGFEYDYLGPALFLGYNIDDGVFLGGGVIYRTYGFRKYPYSTSQKLVGNFSPTTRAFNFIYSGDFVDVFGKIGVQVDVNVQAPNFFTNFYGYGNETEEVNDDDTYFRVRYDNYFVNPAFKLRVSEKSSIKFGPTYQYAKINRDEEGYLDNLGPIIGDDLYSSDQFVGVKFEADIKTIESEVYPEKGIRLLASSGFYSELEGDDKKYSQLTGELRGYYTVRIPMKLTFAARIGAAGNIGEYNIYQANTIGGNAGLSRPGTVRGYHRGRFTGETSVYQNTELRMRLLQIPFYYLPFEFGLSGHHDIGRVWVPGEDSDKWHSGVGGGVWFAPLRMAIFAITYTVSDEEKLFNASMGFFF